MDLVHRGGSAYRGGGVLVIGPTDESVAPFGHSVSENVPADISGLFGAFCGYNDKETGSMAFMVEERPVRGLWLRDRVTGGLASMIRALVMVDMIHYL